MEKVKIQIDNFIPINILWGIKNILIKPLFQLSMIDGKICLALSSHSSSQCCFLSAKDMNNPEALSKKKVNDECLSFGLSPLHCRIRFMECILHIAYKLEIKTWQAKGEQNK